VVEVGVICGDEITGGFNLTKGLWGLRTRPEPKSVEEAIGR